MSNMDRPDKLMRMARAQISADLDQAWADMEAHHADVKRIAREGPDEGDAGFIRLVMALMNWELNWRKAERELLEQGIIDKEIE